MTISTEDLLNSILESFDRIDYVRADSIPNIDLYMDQVTTFMDTKMKQTTRQPGEDKILTKTMINNYAKNDLLPPPIKKKYSKEHIMILIFIYYFKGILSIGDIQHLMTPITEQYFGKPDSISLEEIYETVFSLERESVESLKKEVTEDFKKSEDLFQDAPSGEKEFLQHFAFICMLSFDVYVKKLLIEKLIDQIPKPIVAKERSKPRERSKSGKENE